MQTMDQPTTTTTDQSQTQSQPFVRPPRAVVDIPIIYGQVISGPPGSGKTTYCNGMQEYLRLFGRNAYVINLDPANEGTPKNEETIDQHNNDNKNNNENDDDNTNNNNNNNNNNNDTSNATSSNNTNNNTQLPYDTIFDVCQDVINLSSVMSKLNLGPNGGLLYCMEYIEQHISDICDMIYSNIITKLNQDEEKNGGNNMYLLFDLPGQVELYTHGTCVHNLIHTLIKKLNLRLCVVQLIDSYYCLNVSNFISAVLLNTTTMLRLELPTINVLSKVDLLYTTFNGEQLPFSLDYFTNCNDLYRLLDYLQHSSQGQGGGSGSGGGSSSRSEGGNGNVNGGYDDYDDDEDYYNDNYSKQDSINDSIYDDVEYQNVLSKRKKSKFYIKHEKLHKAFIEIIDDFSLVSFIPLDISNIESMGRIITKIDKCNGYVYIQQHGQQQHEQSHNQSSQQLGKNRTTNTTTTTTTNNTTNPYDLLQCAIQSDSNYELISDIQEKIIESRQQLKKQASKNENKN